jgi:signal transduction histidine kinase
MNMPRLQNNEILLHPQDLSQVELSDVIDAEALQEMMDDYHLLTGMGIGIIDLNGTVLVGTGWQEICVKFHRAVPQSCRFCHESDTSLACGVTPGTFKEYRCKNNMWDIVTPIMLADRHIGNIFLGQFLYDDEEPDYELFRRQAVRFGFDEVAYLAALDKVPRFSRATVQTAMSFYSKLARMISKSNYNNVVLADTLSRSKRYEKELLNKNVELERFIYTVSHDLKSPVITIKGFTGSLAKDLASGRFDRMAGDLKRVDAAADTMNMLLRDLLELSTIGRIGREPETVDMNQLVHDVVMRLETPLRTRGVSVTVFHDLPSVVCDRVRIAEALQNLVENSIRFSGVRNDPAVTIGMREDQGIPVFFVQDNGIGIEEKYHAVIFGLFNKLDSTSSGTGIGLALVKRIIEVHGGTVWVESGGLDTGSRFCFTLPHGQKSDGKEQSNADHQP